MVFVRVSSRLTCAPVGESLFRQPSSCSAFCVFPFVCFVALPLCFFARLPSWRGGVAAWDSLFLRRDISWFMNVGQQCYVFLAFGAILLGLWGLLFVIL